MWCRLILELGRSSVGWGGGGGGSSLLLQSTPLLASMQGRMLDASRPHAPARMLTSHRVSSLSCLQPERRHSLGQTEH